MLLGSLGQHGVWGIRGDLGSANAPPPDSVGFYPKALPFVLENFEDSTYSISQAPSKATAPSIIYPVFLMAFFLVRHINLKE